MAMLGHYELVRALDGGGMSTLYEALDTRIGRTVALKVLTLPPYLSQSQAALLVERLKREARAAGRLSHPNIVTVYEFGEQDGHHFIAMEYLNGLSLRKRLAGGPLAPLEASHILTALAEALDSAHAQGILHRDVKPDNVMLLPDGRVKLADFGVARQIDDATLTQAGAPIGSPAYMAPEQVRGEAASPASDLWSLGVLLYEMLAGSLPFRSENIPSVLHQVVYDPAPPLPGAPREIQAVLDRALAKEPTARYRSAHELAAAFHSAVADQPDAPPRPSPIRFPTGPMGAVPVRKRGLDRGEAGVKGGEAAAAHPTLPARFPLWGGALALVAALSVLLFSLPSLNRPHPVRPARPLARAAPGHPPGGAALKGPRPSVSPPAPPVIVKEVSPRGTASGRPAARRAQHLGRVRRERHGSARLATAMARSRHRSHPSRPEDYPRPVASTPRRIQPLTSASAAALNARGYRLQRQGRQVEAEPLLRAAVRRDPANAYAQYNLGVSLLSQGKAREALSPLQRTAAQQPHRWEPQLRLGQAYERLGESEKARAAYARAQSLRPRRRPSSRPAERWPARVSRH